MGEPKGTDDMKKCTIRAAVIKDAGSIAHIIVETWQTAYTGIVDSDFPPTMRTEAFTRIMEENIQQKKESIFVCTEERSKNRLMGFISGQMKRAEEKYDAEVIGLYVLPEFQGRGIGRLLLERMKEYFRMQNCTNLLIWTLKGAHNNGFYTRQEGVSRESKTIDIGGKQYSAIGFVFNLK